MDQRHAMTSLKTLTKDCDRYILHRGQQDHSHQYFTIPNKAASKKVIDFLINAKNPPAESIMMFSAHATIIKSWFRSLCIIQLFMTMCIRSWVSLSQTMNNSSLDSTISIPSIFQLDLEDTNWIMTSSFIIFTMQTGFGMLESGCVSIKNEVNIMMKNVADVVLGGLTYWIFGFALSFGYGPYTTPFMGVGGFFVDPTLDDPLMGPIFAAFLFQLSFATTATTIVSGAMAERCNFKAYCLFSSLNTVVYCIPAGWAWGEHGFLYKLGYVDIAGSGPVHLIGGSSALVSAIMLGPRLGRYANGKGPLPLGSPVNAVMGLFVLWWGWLAFNSGSTYGVSGAKWHYAARAAVQTMLSSFGGGCVGLGYSMFLRNGHLDIIDLINSILGALVAITAGCYLYRCWEAILIGIVGAIIACLCMPLIDLLGVDDPVGASSVHGAAGIWGVIAVGLFAENPFPLGTTKNRSGLFKGGGWDMFGVQCLGALCFAAWGAITTFIILWFVNKVIPIRLEPYEELLGADLTEHSIRHGAVGLSRTISALRHFHPNAEEIVDIGTVGKNPGHDAYMAENYNVAETEITRQNLSNKDKKLLKNNKNKIQQEKHTTATSRIESVLHETEDNFPKYAWLN